MLTISFKTTSKRFWMKVTCYVYFYGPIEKKIFHNTGFFSIFSLEKVFDKCLPWPLIFANKPTIRTSHSDAGAHIIRSAYF